jgi:cell division protein FtsB
MIPLIIILIVIGVFVILLAILATAALLRNSRLVQDKNAAMRELEEALAGKEHLKAENGRLQQELHYAQVQHTDLSEALESTRDLYNKVLRERNELVARTTVLQEALEAKPTAPKRAVQRRGTQAAQEEA